MPSYIQAYDFFKSKHCELLTKESEFDCKFSSKVTYKATCGHENTIHLTNFYHKKTGLKCKGCRNKSVTIDNYNPNEQEYDGFKVVRDILSTEFQVKKTNEGCLGDMLVKPLYEQDDKWMLVQLKTTRDICHNLYTFSMNENCYNDCLVLCICLKDKKIWLFHNDIVCCKSKINCGLTSRSEYFKYQVDIDNLIENIHKEYAHYKKFKMIYGMMPISVNQRMEQEFRRYREKMIPYYSYVYPEIDGCVTDFFINGYKIQEKIAQVAKRKSNNPIDIITINRTSYKINHRCYNLGENDFYWVWLQNKKVFYVFPERILCEKEFIQVNGNLSDKTRSFTFQEWTKPFKYFINDPCLKQKLDLLFL
jgi:hypothetical protein